MKSFIILASCLLIGSIECTTMAVRKLEKYNIDPDSVTVSGISSGGAMAMQFHMAYSSKILGAGIFAGGPFLCGLNGLAASTMCLLTPELININLLIAETEILAGAMSIDATRHVNGSKVYIFHGTKDSVVALGSGKNIRDMYLHYGADVMTEFSIEAEHGQPTDNKGGRCGDLAIGNYFVINCDYNGAYEMLAHLYGHENIEKPETSVGSVPLLGDFFEFDQKPFFFWPPGTYSLDTVGYAYVPSGCRDGTKQCRLHIAFHGCAAYRKLIGDRFATWTGYLEVAELNDIVMVFPQAESSILPPNPMGCWDWFMYTGPTFPLKIGFQNLGVYRMIEKMIYG